MLIPLALLLLLIAAEAVPASSQAGAPSVETATLSEIAPVSGVVDLPCGARLVVLERDPLLSLLSGERGLGGLAGEARDRLRLVGDAVWLVSARGEPGNATIIVVLCHGNEDLKDWVARLLASLGREGVRRIVVVVDDLGVTSRLFSREEAINISERLSSLGGMPQGIELALINGAPILIIMDGRVLASPDTYLAPLIPGLGLCNSTILAVRGEAHVKPASSRSRASLAGPEGVEPVQVEVATRPPVPPAGRLEEGPLAYLPGILILVAAVAAGILGARALE